MKPMPLLRRLWNWLPPQTWTETYMVITAMLLGLLTLAALIDILKGTLP